jgi:hypothetical protein
MRFEKNSLITAALTAVIAALWSLSATWGVADLVARIDQNSQGLNQELGPLRRPSFDPDAAPPGSDKSMPWYYIGNAGSPFPLIVAADAAHAVAPTAGQRARGYAFWFFGILIPIHQDVVWTS